MATPSAAILVPLERSPVKKEAPSPVVLTPKAAIFNKIEAALGSELPPSARRFAAWWGTVTPAAGEPAPTQVWVLPRTKPVAKREAEPPPKRCQVPKPPT